MNAEILKAVGGGYTLRVQSPVYADIVELADALGTKVLSSLGEWVVKVYTETIEELAPMVATLKTMGIETRNASAYGW